MAKIWRHWKLRAHMSPDWAIAARRSFGKSVLSAVIVHSVRSGFMQEVAGLLAGDHWEGKWMGGARRPFNTIHMRSRRERVEK